jgi:hypothetical protein
MMGRNEMVEVFFDEIQRETDVAWLLLLDSESGETEWFPKSKCEITEANIVQVPQWLAEKKGVA